MGRDITDESAKEAYLKARSKKIKDKMVEIEQEGFMIKPNAKNIDENTEQITAILESRGYKVTKKRKSSKKK